MMRRVLKIFVVPAGTAGASPTPDDDVELEAATEDALLRAAHGALAVRGLRVRAVSFTPTGLVAYGEPRS